MLQLLGLDPRPPALREVFEPRKVLTHSRGELRNAEDRERFGNQGEIPFSGAVAPLSETKVEGYLAALGAAVHQLDPVLWASSWGGYRVPKEGEPPKHVRLEDKQVSELWARDFRPFGLLGAEVGLDSRIGLGAVVGFEIRTREGLPPNTLSKPSGSHLHEVRRAAATMLLAWECPSGPPWRWWAGRVRRWRLGTST
jgi:hypothetical protein